MQAWRRIRYVVAASLFSLACSTSSPSNTPIAANSDAGFNDVEVPDADAGGTPVDKAALCAASFGNALTNAFGRLDGTVLAVVPPAHPTCPKPNSDHVILEVTAKGKPYRMVVNVLSTFGDPDVRFGVLHAPLAGPVWGDGWHTDAPLDYVATLGVHNDGTKLVPYAMDALASTVADHLSIGAKVSVFATSSGGDSAHLVHRNKPNADGAIVANPDSADPTYLLFAFADQTF